MTEEIPTVVGRREGVHVVITCPWCHREHAHGAHEPGGRCKHDPMRGGPCTCPIGSGDGHRVAHCHGDNPGYIVREAS